MKTAILIIAAMVIAGNALADVPDKMTYQGRLLDNVGDPVVDADYSITFTIYDDSTGGTTLWTEIQNVTTEDGLFTVQLGAVMPLDLSVFSGIPRFLGIQVGGDPEISPRTRLATVPYAFQAANAQSAASGSYPLPHTNWICPVFSVLRDLEGPDAAVTVIRIISTDTITNLVTLTFYDESGVFIDQCTKSLAPLEIWTWESNSPSECTDAANPPFAPIMGSFTIEAEGPVAPWGIIALAGGTLSPTNYPYSGALQFYVYDAPDLPR